MPSMTEPSDSPDRPDPGVLRPAAVFPVVLVVGAQALILGIGAAYMLFALVTGQVWSVPGAIFLTVVFGGGALWLTNAAKGLWRGKRWPRAAAFTAQLFSLVAAGAIVWPFTTVGAIALIVAALVAAACLFLPTVVQWTTQDFQRNPR